MVEMIHTAFSVVDETARVWFYVAAQRSHIGFTRILAWVNPAEGFEFEEPDLDIPVREWLDEDEIHNYVMIQAASEGMRVGSKKPSTDVETEAVLVELADLNVTLTSSNEVYSNRGRACLLSLHALDGTLLAKGGLAGGRIAGQRLQHLAAELEAGFSANPVDALTRAHLVANPSEPWFAAVASSA